jgi:hypothetical protein
MKENEKGIKACHYKTKQKTAKDNGMKLVLTWISYM